MPPSAPNPDHDGPLIFRIPADGSKPIESIQVDTTKKRRTFGLGHILDVRSLWNDSDQAVGNSIVLLHNEQSINPIDIHGLWGFLKCVNKDVGLPTNENKYWKDMGDRKVYGDVFLFRLDRPAVEGGMAVYADVSEDLLEIAGDQVKGLLRRFAVVSVGAKVEPEKDGNWEGDDRAVLKRDTVKGGSAWV